MVAVLGFSKVTWSLASSLFSWAACLWWFPRGAGTCRSPVCWQMAAAEQVLQSEEGTEPTFHLPLGKPLVPTCSLEGMVPGCVRWHLLLAPCRVSSCPCQAVGLGWRVVRRLRVGMPCSWPALSWKGPLLRLSCHCAGTLVQVDTVAANAAWVRSPTEKHGGKRFCGSRIRLIPVYFL